MGVPVPPVSSPARLAWQLPFTGFVWTSGFGVMLASSFRAMIERGYRTPQDVNVRAARAFAQVLKLTLSDVSVTYADAFDPAQPSLFCQNHVSLLDAHVASHAIPQPFVGLMLAWHFKVPGYGWMMKATEGIPVHPASIKATRALRKEFRDRAKRGFSVLVFPEGHRTIDGSMRPFQRGVFSMARAAKMPAVPIAVRGLYEVQRKGSPLITPGSVEVFVGPQLEITGLSDKKLAVVMGDMHGAMSTFVARRDDGEAISALST